MRRLLFLLFVFSLIVFGQQARANPWQLTNETVGLSQAGYITVVPNSTPNVWIGTYGGDFTEVSGPGLFSGLAIDCFKPFINGSASLYNMVSLDSVFTPAVKTWLAALLSHAGAPTTSDESVALALSALEFIYEPTATIGDVGSGTMYATGVTPSSITLANQYIANVLSGPWQTPDSAYNVFVWEPVAGQTGQSFLSREPIPEPGTLLVLGFPALLLGLAIEIRRRPYLLMCLWGQQRPG